MSTVTDAASVAQFAGSINELNEIRSRDPGRISRLLAARRKRNLFGPERTLVILACVPPARVALSAAGKPTAMASRTALLYRLVTAVTRPGVDGLLATADIVEDLLMLGVLEEKLVFASMNRGGLQGAVFEMDDRITGYDVRGTVDAGFEGAKILLRIDLE